MQKDALDLEIDAKRQELAEARFHVDALEIEVHALEHAAALRPVVGLPTPRPAIALVTSGAARRGGRQPGAISKVWQKILAKVVEFYPDGATSSEIASFGANFNLANLKPKDARAQAEKYVSLGYFEFVEPDRYRVTERAIERYGFEVPAIRNGAPPEELFVREAAE